MSEDGLSRSDGEPEETARHQSTVELELRLEQRCGLRRWFLCHPKTSDPEPVRLAKEKIERLCRAGFLTHWVTTVEAVYDHRMRGLPVEEGEVWRKLAKTLCMDLGHMRRYPRGLINPISSTEKPPVAPPFFRYRVSCALGVGDHDLSPDTPAWIALSTRLLIEECEPNQLPDKTVLDAYGSYLFDHSDDHDSSLDPRDLTEVLNKPDQSRRVSGFEKGVLETAEIVGAILLHKLGLELDDVG